jgi:hypothetical protein
MIGRLLFYFLSAESPRSLRLAVNEAQMFEEAPMDNQVPTDTYQLGELKTTYERGDAGIYAGTLMILMGGLMIAFGYLPLPGGDGLWIWMCCTLWIIPLGVWMIVQTLGVGKVLVFNGGLVYIEGGRSEVWRWDDIAQVWHDVKVEYADLGSAIRYDYYTIQRADGLKRVFDASLSNHKMLGDTIQREVAKRGGAVWPPDR